MKKIVDGFEIEPKAGTLIKCDEWHHMTRLLECDWDKADFRIESGRWPYSKIAINITITGRTVQYTGSGAKVRIKIEFVGDGEPSEYTGGWLFIET